MTAPMGGGAGPKASRSHAVNAASAVPRRSGRQRYARLELALDGGRRVWRLYGPDDLNVGLFQTREAALDYCARHQWTLESDPKATRG